MKNKTKQVNILISEEVYEEIKNESEILGLQISSLIRMRVLERMREKRL